MTMKEALLARLAFFIYNTCHTNTAFTLIHITEQIDWKELTTLHKSISQWKYVAMAKTVSQQLDSRPITKREKWLKLLVDLFE